MAVTFSDDSVTVVGGEYTLEDIYNEAQKTFFNRDDIKKLENTYIIEKDFIIGDKTAETIIRDTNITLIVKGELFQVYRGSKIYFGEIDDNGCTSNGCYIIANNLIDIYGFGDKDKDDPGELYIYNSKLDLYTFWSFFGGPETTVQIIDCYINGFGRIEGNNSILYNLTFQSSHGRYGILSPKGSLKQFENLVVKHSNTYTKDNIDYHCAMYYNADISDDMTVIEGEYSGYDDIVWCEPTAGKLTLLDVKYDKSKELTRHIFSHNKSIMGVQYSFKPTFRLDDGTIQEVSLTITDKDNNIIFSGESTDGYIDAIIETLSYGIDDSSPTYNGPFNLQIDYSIDDVDFSTNREYLSGDPFQGVIYLSDTIIDDSRDDSSSNSCCDCDSIDDIISSLENRLNDKLDSIESGIKQVVREVTDEVEENETIIKETGFSIII